jgi:diguanylate cyclase (GGDEF)-like protein
MIARHADLPSTLHTLCLMAGEAADDRQIAFFLIEKDHWELAATGDLTPESEILLARIVPETLSEDLFAAERLGPDRNSCSLGDFRCRHLFSGIGEMLGLLVCLTPVTAHAVPCQAEFIEPLCRLAALAIEQRNLLDELTWQAEHDTVTGLCTRTRFEKVLSSHLPAVGDAPGTALLCINLDRFRLVNGVLGHSLGNRVLKFVGMRFTSCLPGGALLARVGGDEFAVLARADQAIPLAHLLLDQLADAFCVDEHQLFIGASIGISLARHSSTAESLQREGYIALYHAKRQGKGRWVEFSPAMEAIPPERLEMEKCLRSALVRNEMSLAWQAQIEISTGAVMGAEALLRWNPEGLGSIAPAAFIPILEETGLIVEYGLWVLREACRQGAAWREAGTALRIAVNVSALQFLDPGFARDVERILAATGFPPALLELELTESLFIEDFERARRVFRHLQRLGVALALDDFGTGQSSLSYLQQLPFQRLKIDRAFVAPMKENSAPHPLVANIIQMAASLGMKTLAEGIDDVVQLDMLRSMGCDEGQGYFFSLPLPADEFFAFWRAGLESAAVAEPLSIVSS